MAIRTPFGEAYDSYSFATAAGRKEFAIRYPITFINSPTAVKSRELVVTAAGGLPIPSFIHIQHLASASGSKLVLGTGFAGVSRMAKTTATDGTGNWYQSFTYNGTAFIPITDQFLKK
jgi:hypothetical protein